eukprot:GHVU01236019.1.p1 GENE.GHVU01236019.1~~GHVU01236019.1.p1  ORF type:complete len:121 (-),score=17.34 GHVU01236019.1:42-404(-)
MRRGTPRDWEGSGAIPNGKSTDSGITNPKWGDKEWTKRVEKAYWHELPTPPPSPKLIPAVERAEKVAAQVLVDLCQPQERGKIENWGSDMDEQAESKRKALFRTQYRAVESEVNGLAVKW